MDVEDDQHRMLQQGIAVMTAWAADDQQLPDAIIDGVIRDHGEEALIAGLVRVAGSLLEKLEALGESPYAVLQEVADRHRLG